ncbi:MAG: hypothetical protein JRJ19_05840 [Deltaproteobacteria bacterium]|nr:hypothetical protein [Deltaproteobacteria bacterium]MBW1871565.1 hypothetical protein [Deltaproteobacteria bacterium]
MLMTSYLHRLAGQISQTESGRYSWSDVALAIGIVLSIVAIFFVVKQVGEWLHKLPLRTKKTHDLNKESVYLPQEK